MGYALHIERVEEPPIELAEWRSAVNSTTGVRLVGERVHRLAGAEGAAIEIDARVGDAEVLFSEGDWGSVFCWRGGSASFDGRYHSPDAPSAVWNIATQLAKRLNAVIRGDEGEKYDLSTGEVIEE
ncbi:MAG: hypothetical protein KDA69_17135 [Planctomycetaceae bacterium]|nr:hypothetical protein [Planctomycetaceae bacterium]